MVRNSPYIWIQKFRVAFLGVATGIRGQNSFAIHIPAAIIAWLLCWVFHVTAVEWSLISLCIFSVWVTEIINTSIEYLAKSITDRYDINIKAALDSASGAVLIAAFGSLLVGGLIFVPKIMTLLGD